LRLAHRTRASRRSGAPSQTLISSPSVRRLLTTALIECPVLEAAEPDVAERLRPRVRAAGRGSRTPRCGDTPRLPSRTPPQEAKQPNRSALRV
jgi:hypothetical protein